MARVLPPITINGTMYRVLLLGGVRGPRYLLRSDAGELVGLFPRAAEPMRLYAAPLIPNAKPTHPLACVDFFEGAGKLIVRS